MNFTKSQQLFERAQRVIPGGVNSPVRAWRGVGGISPARSFSISRLPLGLPADIGDPFVPPLISPL